MMNVMERHMAVNKNVKTFMDRIAVDATKDMN